jgi:UDP-glucose 4-epimerase
MRILITGGAGFIGSALARAHVERGDAVTVADSLVTGQRDLVPEGARFVRLDVGTPDLDALFRERGPFDVVSHHAALKDVRRALVDPQPDAEANIVGTLNVLRVAREHGTGRFVFPSSAAIYGDPALFPTPETAPIAPISPYGISKAAAELYCAFFARAHGLPTVALRYSTVYGPRASEESEAGSITTFTRRVVAGEAPTIFGDGEQSRDFIYVDDVVRANLAVLDRAPRPWAVYNVSTGVEVTINEVCRLLGSAADSARPPEYRPARAGEVRKNLQDSSLIRRETGWMAQVSLHEGLQRMVAAFSEERTVAGATG